MNHKETVLTASLWRSTPRGVTLVEPPPAPALPTATRRTQGERTASMRARLLEATFECLAELGYARTTTTEVCRRAGVSRGAQLHHFPTKDDLVIAAHEHVLSRRQEEYAAAFAGLTPEERTPARAIDLLWEMYQGPIFDAWLELAVAARRDPALRDRFVEAEAHYVERSERMTPELGIGQSDPAVLEFTFAVLLGTGLLCSVGLGATADETVGILKSLAEIFGPDQGGAA
jgi:AcrR family transcriptional regulator